jgi:molybdopterin converting factor small subunit
VVRVRVLFLGSVRERLEKDFENLVMEDRSTVFMLRRRLFHKMPKAQASHLMEGLSFTVNLGLVALNTVLRDGDEVAVIPKDVVQKT